MNGFSNIKNNKNPKLCQKFWRIDYAVRRI